MNDSFKSFEINTADVWACDLDDNVAKISPSVSRLVADDVIKNHRASLDSSNNHHEVEKNNGSFHLNGFEKKFTQLRTNLFEEHDCLQKHFSRLGTCVRLATNDRLSLEKISSIDTNKMEKFRNLLLNSYIDLETLKSLSWAGIPFCYRPKVWKLLMNYLPSNSTRREQALIEKRMQYATFVDQYYKTSASLKQPNETINQIRKDTKRTALVYNREDLKEMLERILYICAWRNPACSYVQGMNDLVMPFLAVFINEYVKADINSYGHLVLDSDLPLTKEQLANLEADIYWCFSQLVQSIQDNFISNQPAIHRNVKLLKIIVSRVDEPLHQWLEENKVAYLQFSFRWMNNLLIRELPMRCCIRLWDTYLSEGDGFQKFHVYVCAAFLIYFSEKLKEEPDFQGLLLLLQKLPTSEWTGEEIEMILARAYSLKMTFADAPGHLDTQKVEITF